MMEEINSNQLRNTINWKSENQLTSSGVLLNSSVWLDSNRIFNFLETLRDLNKKFEYLLVSCVAAIVWMTLFSSSHSPRKKKKKKCIKDRPKCNTFPLYKFLICVSSSAVHAHHRRFAIVPFSSLAVANIVLCTLLSSYSDDEIVFFSAECRETHWKTWKVQNKHTESRKMMKSCWLNFSRVFFLFFLSRWNINWNGLWKTSYGAYTRVGKSDLERVQKACE